MKKIICCILLCVCLCIALVGCDALESRQTNINTNDMYEFVDPDTGVHYWIYSHEDGYAGMGGIIPRLNSDGTVMVTD